MTCLVVNTKKTFLSEVSLKCSSDYFTIKFLRSAIAEKNYGSHEGKAAEK
jgi:hypothetical protein